MIQPKTGERPDKNVPRAVIDIVDARDRLKDRWAGHVIGPGRNLHHRQLRSQGVHHNPGNLVTLSGSGTTGTHGMVHHNRALGQAYGFIVPSWIADPSLVPIRLANVYGVRGWALLADDGTERSITPQAALFAMRTLGVWKPTESWL